MKKNHQKSNSSISEFVQSAFFLCVLLFNLTFYSASSQQNSETGLPYIQNYSPDEYGAFIQNWDAVQDSLDIIYFANGDGVLSYNGASWKLLELPGLVSPNAIASTKKGTLLGSFMLY